MSEPEYDCGGNADGRKAGVRATVVTDRDAAPVLDAAKGVFDTMPLAIEGLVILDDDLAVLRGGMQGMMPFDTNAARKPSLS